MAMERAPGPVMTFGPACGERRWLVISYLLRGLRPPVNDSLGALSRGRRAAEPSCGTPFPFGLAGVRGMVLPAEEAV
jgi:hypothetical protein